MKVADVMTRGVISLSPTDTMRRAAELMLRYDVSGLPVLDCGRLVGIITESDFLRRSETGTERNRPRRIEFLTAPERLADEYVHSHAREVGAVMTRDVVTVDEGASLKEAVELMDGHHVKRLPVTRHGTVVGILSRTDLLHAFLVATPKNPPAPLGDEAIGARLTAELDRQPWLSRGSITAAVENGVVVLEGAIRDERQRRALMIAAENLPGVKQVIDRLHKIDLTGVS
jgi:CBS domain-containing protein